jgi:hypothetical protein
MTASVPQVNTFGILHLHEVCLAAVAALKPPLSL